MTCCNTFDKLAWIYNPLIKLSGKPKKYYNKIKDLSNPVNTTNILDVGGGTGIIANYFLNKTNKITVLDPSQRMLDKLRSEITKVHGVAQNIKYKDKTFDLIYCVDSFHHFTNGYTTQQFVTTTNQCIQELLRVLKEDGKLIIIEFDMEKFNGKLIRFFENKLMRWGSNFYTKTEFEKLFREYDVSVEMLELDRYCFIAKITKQHPKVYI